MRASTDPLQHPSDQSIQTTKPVVGNRTDADPHLKDEIKDYIDSLPLTLIKCGADDNRLNSQSISFSEQSFISILQILQLSSEVISFLVTGTPIFLPTSQGKYSTITMRTPLANSNNWTLALSWDYQALKTKGLIHGLQKGERDSLMSALDEFKGPLVHPLLLPVLLCELLTEADSTQIKRHALNLYQVEMQTAYMRVEKPVRPSTKDQDQTAEDDVEELTRRLNAIVSRLAFHEMRINANIVLVSAIIEELSALLPLLEREYSQAASQWQELGKPLRLRLQGMQIEHKALLLEVSCNQKIAAGQLQIVYNLIAQRDARENLRQASTSTAIARITKEDGFAMRTIAVMTVAFLPATAISSLFSMGMFDWHAEADAPVISSRFWVYWAVAVPLTLIVFGL